MPATLSVLKDLATQQRRRAVAVLEAQAALKAAEASYREIAEGTLPDAMDELGMSSFTTDDGVTFKIDERIVAGIPADCKGDAFAWFIGQGFGSIVKREIKLMAKGDDEVARIRLKLDGEDFAEKPSIHASTLGKWCRERMEGGMDLPPEDLVRVHRRRVAKYDEK